MKRGSYYLVFALLAVVQMVLCNYFTFTPYIVLSILPVMVLTIPIRLNTIWTMCIAFVTGLAVDLLAEGLIGRFPACEEKLRANLAAYQERIEALRDAMRQTLGEASLLDVVVFHEALPYFARACDLPVLATVCKEPEEDLSASQLVRILELIRTCDPLPVILKSTETDRASEVLASETGAPVCELDTLVSGPADPPLDYYESVMLRNLDAVLEKMR